MPLVLSCGLYVIIFVKQMCCTFTPTVSSLFALPQSQLFSADLFSNCVTVIFVVNWQDLYHFYKNAMLIVLSCVNCEQFLIKLPNGPSPLIQNSISYLKPSLRSSYRSCSSVATAVQWHCGCWLNYLNAFPINILCSCVIIYDFSFECEHTECIFTFFPENYQEMPSRLI